MYEKSRKKKEMNKYKNEGFSASDLLSMVDEGEVGVDEVTPLTLPLMRISGMERGPVEGGLSVPPLQSQKHQT